MSGGSEGYGLFGGKPVPANSGQAYNPSGSPSALQMTVPGGGDLCNSLNALAGIDLLSPGTLETPSGQISRLPQHTECFGNRKGTRPNGSALPCIF